MTIRLLRIFARYFALGLAQSLGWVTGALIVISLYKHYWP